MTVDSSALVEIPLGKAGAEALMVALARPEPTRISAGNLLESYMVIDRRGIPEAGLVLDDTIMRAALIVEPVTKAQVATAREAWRLFGASVSSCLASSSMCQPDRS